MKIIITGGTGFLGKLLSTYLLSLHHEIVIIQRSDWLKGSIHLSKLINSSDVVINLAGSPVIKRWTNANKMQIVNSRIELTRSLVEILNDLSPEERPKILISASAIGIYDSIHIHSEQSLDFDKGFLANVCMQWENCLKPLSDSGIRICVIRIGMVLGRNGGMLKKLIPLFKAGLGGKIGSGKQGFSFIHYHDFCRAIVFMITHKECIGVFNLTSPQFTTNVDFTKTLARACHRYAFLPVPEIALKLVYGEAAVSLIQGQSVKPEHLLESGFTFLYPDLESALQEILTNQ
jgi:uncharacterized protein (TIGR01777 family)